MTTARTIGVDVREWHAGTSTGIARVLTGFLEWATAHTPHRFVLFGNQRSENRVVGEHITMHREHEGNRLLWDQVTLPRLAAETGAEVLLSPYYKGPLRSPCPVVVTANDVIELHFPGGSRLKRLALPAWMRLVLKRASRVLTLSEFSRRDLVATLGLSPSRVAVVPAGIDPGFCPHPIVAPTDSVLRRLGLPPGYVLYVGRCAAHKNVGTLVRAWAALPEALREAHPLVLAGGDVARFEALGEAAGARVFAPGFVDDNDLAVLYRGAAVMGFPSLYEGFGLPPLEAMASGTPVVAADSSSLPEVLGDAALLADPRNEAHWTSALERVLRSAELRDDLVRRGAARAGRYTPERAARSLLDNVLAAAAGGTP
jgi:alpha-1,3-rhamnosyl/mannosyltransferase